jgi:hypothetical protein
MIETGAEVTHDKDVIIREMGWKKGQRAARPGRRPRRRAAPVLETGPPRFYVVSPGNGSGHAVSILVAPHRARARSHRAANTPRPGRRSWTRSVFAPLAVSRRTSSAPAARSCLRGPSAWMVQGQSWYRAVLMHCSWEICLTESLCSLNVRASIHPLSFTPPYME